MERFLQHQSNWSQTRHRDQGLQFVPIFREVFGFTDKYDLSIPKERG